jgi:predicted dehydrogenase
MNTDLNRRSFLKRTALVAGALSGAGLLPAQTATPRRHLVADKLNCVQIGCGERGFRTHLDTVIGKHAQNLYAVVDPDEKKHAAVKAWLTKANLNPDKTQFFTDYRVMFDKVGSQLDAVFCAAPNHHHATASMIAMQLGINIYCEKPLVHDIASARRLSEMARKHPELATQMGAQGHCEEGYRSLCEYIWGGTIGNVTETHSWTDRANGGAGPRPPVQPVPEGMHWDSWIGPSPYRDFHADLHPHEWHGWYDFGNASIGNMGCHVMDGVFWALKVEHPTSIEAEYIRGGSDERYPLGTTVRWDIPARSGMPPLKAYWYDGLNATTTEAPRATKAVGAARNIAPLVLQLQKQYPEEQFAADGGTLYVGEKGTIYTDTYGGRMHILPMDKMRATPKPPQTVARPKDVFTNFIEACLAGKTETAVPFEYGARLTEFIILANLAMKAGVGKKVEWNGPEMKVTNLPELNALVTLKPRTGWTV